MVRKDAQIEKLLAAAADEIEAPRQHLAAAQAALAQSKNTGRKIRRRVLAAALSCLIVLTAVAAIFWGLNGRPAVYSSAAACLMVDDSWVNDKLRLDKFNVVDDAFYTVISQGRERARLAELRIRRGFGVDEIRIYMELTRASADGYDGYRRIGGSGNFAAETVFENGEYITRAYLKDGRSYLYIMSSTDAAAEYYRAMVKI